MQKFHEKMKKKSEKMQNFCEKMRKFQQKNNEKMCKKNEFFKNKAKFELRKFIKKDKNLRIQVSFANRDLTASPIYGFKNG